MDSFSALPETLSARDVRLIIRMEEAIFDMVQDHGPRTQHEHRVAVSIERRTLCKLARSRIDTATCLGLPLQREAALFRLVRGCWC